MLDKDSLDKISKELNSTDTYAAAREAKIKREKFLAHFNIEEHT